MRVSTLKPKYKVLCENCNWHGTRGIPTKAKRCPRCGSRRIIDIMRS